MENYYLGSGKASWSNLFSPKPTMKPQVIYKQSNLRFNSSTNEITLTPVGLEQEMNINLIADAECATEKVSLLHGKESPSRVCDCGFHGYSDYSDVRSHGQQGEFTLKVIASGKMLESEKGYWYGHQRVEEIIISSCADPACWKLADRLKLNADNVLVPVCRWSHRYYEESISFSTLEVMIAISLPDAPRITVRSENPDIIPWEEDSRR